MAERLHVIRPMAIDDYDVVLALWEASEGVGLGESDTRPAIASYLDRNRGLSLIAEDDRGIAGAVLCGHDGRRGYLHHLAVAVSHRGRGLGRALVDACLDGLRAQGIARCTIVVYADNADGEAFWTRTGWVGRGDLRVMQRAIDLAG
jgi:ribosomal protein S18 acetylase RimI-like enzyme